MATKNKGKLVQIDSLTAEQEASLPAFRDKWVAIGLATGPADMERARAALGLAFAEAGKEAPTTLVRTSSPLAAAITVAILRTMPSVRDSVLASVSDSVRDSVSASVRASVSASVRASVSASVSDSVLASVSDSVLASVRDSVSASVRASVSASVSDSVSDSVRDSVSDVLSDWWRYDMGQWSCYWLSFYDVFSSLGIAACSRLNGLSELAMSSGWNVVFEKIAFIGDRPEVVALDDTGQLHREDGAAVAYSDGWGVYAIHGVRVPEYVTMRPSEITPEKIAAEGNAEIRRIMVERFPGGVGAYLQATGAKVIDVDTVKITATGSRTMPRALMRDATGQHWFIGTDGSTERVYSMPVPEAKTCRQAHESISGLDESLCVAQS